MKDELLSRRLFFKQAAQATLPILAGSSIVSTLISCNKDGNEIAPTDNDNISEASGKIGNYEYVDLGLSVKWARYNLGASKPENYGSYRMGIIDNSQTGVISENGMTISMKTIQGGKLDIVTNRWGINWKIPSKKDFEELITNCSYQAITYNGIAGLKFVSKKNGNSIFFPFGNLNKNDKYYSPGTSGFYWSSDIKYVGQYVSQTEMYYLYIQSNKVYISYQDCVDQMSIRPVSSKSGTQNTCGNNCTANCANNSNNSGCSNCASSCSTSCKTECEYNCAATCMNHCGGGCNDSCGGTCTYLSAGTGCSGCARSCYNRCYTSCNYACSNNCESSCVHGSK